MSYHLALQHNTYSQYLKAAARLHPNIANFALSQADYLLARGCKAEATLAQKYLRANELLKELVDEGEASTYETLLQEDDALRQQKREQLSSLTLAKNSDDYMQYLYSFQGVDSLLSAKEFIRVKASSIPVAEWRDLSSREKLDALKEERAVVKPVASAPSLKKKRPFERKFVSGRKIILSSEGKWYNIKTVSNPDIDKDDKPRTEFSKLYDFVAFLTITGPMLFVALLAAKLLFPTPVNPTYLYGWTEHLPLVGIAAGIAAVLGLEALMKITQYEDKKKLTAARKAYSRSAPIYQQAFENRVHASSIPQGSHNGFAVCVEYGQEQDAAQLFEYHQGKKIQVKPIKTQTLNDNPDLALQQVHELAMLAEEMEMSAWHAVSESDAVNAIEAEMAQADEQLAKETVQQRRQAIASVLGVTAIQTK